VYHHFIISDENGGLMHSQRKGGWQIGFGVSHFQSSRRRTFIIVTSGLAADWQSKKIMDLGIQEFLVKPFTADALLETLRRVLDAAPNQLQL
jgi:DNA-binding response OmpR family regulator